MVLCHAPIIFLAEVKPQSFLLATLVSAFVRAKAEHGLGRVVVSVLCVSSVEPLPSCFALKVQCVGIEFPEYLLPREFHGVLAETYELLHVESTIKHVLGNNFSMEIHENFRFGTSKFFLLFLCE
jgi:hypothetical protein